MKKELWVLAVWGVRGRKRSSFLLLIVLILSFTVAVISLSVTESMRKTNEEYRYDTYGAWYGAITSGKEEDEAFLEECEGIENMGITKSYGMVASNAGMTGIGTMDDAFCEIGRISLQDGYFPRAADEGVYTFTYAILTYIVTLLAVVCIYTIQMQKQVKQIALFRSVGITKSQLRWMSFFETVCISIPAVAAGVICGSIGIRLILHLLVYAGNVDVFVVIPLSVILPLILLWIAGIFVMRVLVLQIALRQPLTGRLAMSQRKLRKVRILRRAEIILLSSLFCITLFFTAMQSMTQIYWIRYWKNQACYIMYTGEVSSWDPPENVNVLSKERFEMYCQIPGVSWINGYSRAQVKLEFEGSENNEFYNAQLALSQAWNADNLYTVPKEKWDDFSGKTPGHLTRRLFAMGSRYMYHFLRMKTEIIYCLAWRTISVLRTQGLMSEMRLH